MSDSRQDDLENLIHSDGWLLFKEEARKQWGPEGYGRKMARIMDLWKGGDPVALTRDLATLHATTEDINELVKWPERELKKLQPKDVPEMSMHRGGR